MEIFMAGNSVTKKIIVFIGCASVILAPIASQSMQIIFDKTYNISRNAHITSLNWKTVSFTKLSGSRVKYQLVAQHPEGQKLEYLKSVDNSVSTEIKERLVRAFDISSAEMNFENGEVHVTLELPYDFETRYLPIKLVTQDGYEDYIVRLRFGDYRFLVANKVINRMTNRDVSKIAGKDPNDLYQVRKQAKRRVVIKKKQDAPVFTVDDIYADAQANRPARNIAESGSAPGDTVVVEEKKIEEKSLFSQFESLSQQYGNEVVNTEERRAAARIDTQAAKIELPEDAEELTLAETLPAKILDEEMSLSESSLVSEDTPSAQEFAPEDIPAESNMVSVDDMLFDEAPTLVSEDVLSSTETEQLVEQNIDEIVEEKADDRYANEESLFDKFAAAEAKYSNELDEVRKSQQQELEELNHQEVAVEGQDEAYLYNPEDGTYISETQTEVSKDQEQVTPAVEEKKADDFLVYETVETPVEEEVVSDISSDFEETQNVASVAKPEIKETYTQVPDDGSIPWLDGTTESFLQSDQKEESVNRAPTSMYDVAPKEWVFTYKKGFVFKSTVYSENNKAKDDKRTPSSNFDESDFDDLDSNIKSFEDEMSDSSSYFKKKDYTQLNS